MQMAQFDADHDRDLPQALALAEQKQGQPKHQRRRHAGLVPITRTGAQDEAKAAIQTALARHTPDAAILYHAGMIYAKAGDRVTAGKCLAHALSLNPDFSPVGAKTAAATLKQLGSRPPGAA